MALSSEEGTADSQCGELRFEAATLARLTILNTAGIPLWNGLTTYKSFHKNI